jgi:hypothetical protein
MNGLCTVGLVFAAVLFAWPATAQSNVPATDDLLSETESGVSYVLEGKWLDPKGSYWEPRRGARVELAANWGGEAAFSALAPDRLPTIGGTTLQGLLRYYPVDRLAIVVGTRSYFGIDNVTAAGTTASSVLSAVTGIRYDLVRENRFSLLWDLYSGPSLYSFGSLLSFQPSTYALGGEMGTAIALCYTLGPFTAELRGVIGGRAGASSSPFQRSDDVGPFSALYAGADLGATWSRQ